LVVSCRALASGFVPSLHIFQLHAQDRGLHGVEAAVPSELFVNVTARAAVIAQSAHVRRHLGVVCGDEPGIAVSAEILGGIKAEGRGYAHGSSSSSAPARADGL